MSINKLVALIGCPVNHSLSPVFQNAAFKELSLNNWAYVPIAVHKTNLKEAVLGLRALGFVGANVTVPYKEAVLSYLKILSDSARLIGAVNTIAIDGEERLIGHNTDALGFIKDINDHGIDVANISALVLGAGGSAKAIVYALLEHGCKKITILNRTKSKADEIFYRFKDLFKNTSIDTAVLDKAFLKSMPAYDLVINCTSIGLADTKDQMPWDENIRFNSSQVVYDLIYNPHKTRLLKHAENCGAKAINGLGMLIHQGALAFKIWTGKEAPLKVMKRAVL